MINGAVLENGDRRTRVSIVTSGANILRLKDAIHPEEATTPVKRVCYIAQLVLSGDTPSSEAKNQIASGLEQLSHVFTDHDSRSILDDATQALNNDKFYQALKSLRKLIPRESRLLSINA